MARMPGAIWRPLASNWASQPRMKSYDFFCIHTMVGGIDGTDNFFRNTNGVGYGGTESHFGVGADGTIYQWQDTDFQADANGDGNWHVISSENADTGAPFPKWSGSDVPALTPAQVEANAKIAVWLYHTHGIPLGIAGSSKPGARGLAAHRYGVPGYMPAGAERWSTSQGKACPGDRRIAQLPAISARAHILANLEGDDDLPYTLEQIAQAVWTFGIGGAVADWTGGAQSVNTVVADIFHNARVSAQQSGQAVGHLVGGNADGKNNFHWLAEQIAAAVASIPGAQVDQTALIAAIESSVTFTKEELAKTVNDDADHRARDGDPSTGPAS